ncbi:MAG: hypothetical protein KatS3mg053_0065 [Candidatus Roseilinea sp.]|nr:MAG: hypothetical protein KatS3mg053_0065 [Candidatus Roseilinea sp.]
MDWLPLIIAAIIGIIIGAIFTVIPYRRRVEEAESRFRDLDAKFRNAERELNDTRSQVQTLQANIRTTEASLVDSRNLIATLESNVQALSDEKTSLEASVQALKEQKAALEANIRSLMEEKAGLETHLNERVTELEQMKSTLAQLRSQFDEATARVAELTTQLDGANAELATIKTNYDAVVGVLGSKEVELNSLAAEVQKLHHDVEVGSTVKEDLEAKLARTRNDVAAELALYTSTLIKMKEDSLGKALAYINALKARLSEAGLPVPDES